MSVAEFDDWLPRARRAYAQDMIEHAGYRPDAATAKAEADFAHLLPEGLATAGQSLFSIEDEGELAGDLWVEEQEQDQERALFVYDLHVRKGQRGRGLGRAAMLFTEDEARRRGISRVSLNVFGENGVARALYPRSVTASPRSR